MTLAYDTLVGLTSSTMINRLYKKINEIRIVQIEVTPTVCADDEIVRSLKNTD